MGSEFIKCTNDFFFKVRVLWIQVFTALEVHESKSTGLPLMFVQQGNRRTPRAWNSSCASLVCDSRVQAAWQKGPPDSQSTVWFWRIPFLQKAYSHFICKIAWSHDKDRKENPELACWVFSKNIFSLNPFISPAGESYWELPVCRWGNRCARQRVWFNSHPGLTSKALLRGPFLHAALSYSGEWKRSINFCLPRFFKCLKDFLQEWAEPLASLPIPKDAVLPKVHTAFMEMGFHQFFGSPWSTVERCPLTVELPAPG